MKKWFLTGHWLKTTVGVPFYVCAVCMVIVKKELIDRFSLGFMEHIAYGEDTLFMRDLLDGMTLEDEKRETKHLKLALMMRCRNEGFENKW